MNKNLKAARAEKWVTLFLKDGRTLIGFYNDRLEGWARVYEDNPKRIPARDIAGWEPFEGEPPRPTPERGKGPRKPVQVIGQAAALECVARRALKRERGGPRKPLLVIGLPKRED